MKLKLTLQALLEGFCCCCCCCSCLGLERLELDEETIDEALEGASLLLVFPLFGRSCRALVVHKLEHDDEHNGDKDGHRAAHAQHVHVHAEYEELEESGEEDLGGLGYGDLGGVVARERLVERHEADDDGRARRQRVGRVLGEEGECLAVGVGVREAHVPEEERESGADGQAEVDDVDGDERPVRVEHGQLLEYDVDEAVGDGGRHGQQHADEHIAAGAACDVVFCRWKDECGLGDQDDTDHDEHDGDEVSDADLVAEHAARQAGGDHQRRVRNGERVRRIDEHERRVEEDDGEQADGAAQHEKASLMRRAEQWQAHAAYDGQHGHKGDQTDDADLLEAVERVRLLDEYAREREAEGRQEREQNAPDAHHERAQ